MRKLLTVARDSPTSSAMARWLGKRFGWRVCGTFGELLDGGAVLGLRVLFSGESQSKGSQKSERCQVFSGLKSGSGGVL